MKIGSVVSWETWGGNKYRGIVKELDGDCLYVDCSDGKERCIDYNENTKVEKGNDK